MEESYFFMCAKVVKIPFGEHHSTTLNNRPQQKQHSTSVPVICKLQGEPCVVGRLDGDDVSAEVGSQEQGQGADDVGALGFSPR